MPRSMSLNLDERNQALQWPASALTPYSTFRPHWIVHWLKH